jgi:transposase
VIELGTGTRVWIVAGVTDLRSGFTGLSAMVQTKLEQDPFSCHRQLKHPHFAALENSPGRGGLR